MVSISNPLSGCSEEKLTTKKSSEAASALCMCARPVSGGLSNFKRTGTRPSTYAASPIFALYSFLPNFPIAKSCSANKIANLGLCLAYRLQSLGSMSILKSHSSPALCIQSGASLNVPA